MDERELRASLCAVGAILPVLRYDSEAIDGRKRSEMCAELGVSIAVVDCSTLQDACSRLYVQHPTRAVELAQRHGIKTLRALAEHCGTTVSAIGRELARAKSKQLGGAEKKRRRLLGHEEMRRLRDSRMVMVRTYMEPELRAYGHELAKTKGHGNLSKLVRDLLWEKAAMLPRAPLHAPNRVQPPNGRRRTA